PSLAQILERMMSKSRDARQATVGQVREELQNWLAQQDADFLKTNQPPARLRKGIAPPAVDTGDGWNRVPLESFTPLPQTRRPHDSNVVDDPDLGRFLTSLSDHAQPDPTESDRINSARTEVSITPPGVPPPPAPPRTADAAQIHVGDDSGVHA